jgi:hypothetical protein
MALFNNSHASPTNNVTTIIPDTVHDVKGRVVVFIGDSHTSYSEGWQYMLSKKTGLTSFNHSVGGIGTLRMLDITKNVLNKYHNYLFIWGGANDMFNGNITPQKAFKNVQQIVNYANKKNIKVVVLTGFSPKHCVNVSSNPTKLVKYQQRYVEYQKLLLDSIKGATVIKNHFVNKDNGDCADYICHMTIQGHRKMSDSIIKHLKWKLVK